MNFTFLQSWGEELGLDRQDQVTQKDFLEQWSVPVADPEVEAMECFQVLEQGRGR
ncbi:MAG: hypothetical protein HC904_03280 [Blastochloris sp.]|nr:hypothetical protein [Blastochloris sp.]